jgi:hypothetical protein
MIVGAMGLIGRLAGRVSAAVLLLGGIALLFAADVLLPVLAPASGADAGARVGGARVAGVTWIGQLLGAAWLGLAALNWLSRDARLGGIYGRPVVLANLVLYVVSALTMLRALPAVGVVGWVVAGPALALAVVYAALLLRGPFDAPRGGGPRPDR